MVCYNVPMAYTEEQRNYHRAYYHIRRKKLTDYLGGVCVICGMNENLHFDHVDPAKKSFEIKSNLTLNDIVKAELDKCQLLCEYHHKQKTSQENSGFTHGSMYAWMKKKCPCPVCNQAKWLWNDKRNVTRRKGSGYNVLYRRNGETR